MLTTETWLDFFVLCYMSLCLRFALVTSPTDAADWGVKRELKNLLACSGRSDLNDRLSREEKPKQL